MAPAPSVTHASDGGFVAVTSQVNVTYMATTQHPANASLGRTGAGFPIGSVRVTYVDGGVQSIPGQELSWQPKNSTAGNLLGTIRTLDGLGEFQDLNCSAHARNGDPNQGTDWITGHEPEHCVYGVASTRGLALIDDTDSPIWTEVPSGGRRRGQDTPTFYWAPRPTGTCPAQTIDSSKAPCVPGDNPSAEGACIAAGCCWEPAPALLNLYYSGQRNDHLTEAQCEGCGPDYTEVGPQMQVMTGASRGANVSLWLFWSPDQTDNVVSSIPPAQPGYTNTTRLLGYLWDSPLEGTMRVQLWYKAPSSSLGHRVDSVQPADQPADHWTTAGAEQEQQAQSEGYTLVKTLGYALPPQSTLGTASTAPSCYRRVGRADLYLFAHGSDYRGAVADFALVGGSIPLPRKHWMGWSWSTWSDPGSGTQNVPGRSDWEGYFQALDEANIGLSTMTLDCEWHVSGCWGATYTFNETRFPQPRDMAQQWLEKGVPMGANIHDTVGVGPLETNYEEFAKAVGADPSTNATIAANFTDPAYMEALHALMIERIREEQLVSFPWTDWQQGMGPAVGISGSNPTFLLNHARGYDPTATESSPRPLQHSRFGGLGNHRYTSLFGGDVRRDMPSAKFMVYMNTVAANALAAWWGQELMQLDSNHQEVFTRLAQSSGAWGPITTFWGNGGADDRIWTMDEPYRTAVYESLRDRMTLLPYRYYLGRMAHETGLAPQRPMYYYEPARLAPESYEEGTMHQYMLGDSILVAPAVDYMDPATNATALSVWLPSCDSESGAGGAQTAWADWRTGGAGNWSAVFGASVAPRVDCRGGAQWVNVSAPIDLVPAFARSDAILPLLPRSVASRTGAGSQAFGDLEVLVMPDGWTSNATVYDDDGVTNAYANEAGYVKISVQGTHGSTGRALALSVGHSSGAGGGSGGLSEVRSYTLRALGIAKRPQSVSVKGQPLKPAQAPPLPGTMSRPDPGTWWHFEEQQLLLARSAGPVPLPAMIEVTDG